MLTAVITITLLSIAFGLLLGYSAVRFHVDGDPIVDQIDSLLPQTQCGQCGYAGCRPYAEAIADGDDANKCPPGGEATMVALSELLGREPMSLEDEEAAEKPKSVAFIVEEECIGCTLCIQACPVDAIVGAAKSMHTVIVDECTGCELCIPPCPVECIHMHPIEANLGNWKWPFPGQEAWQRDNNATVANGATEATSATGEA